MNTEKGLMVYVYRTATMPDCTNRGLTCLHNRLLLVGNGPDTPREDLPALYPAYNETYKRFAAFPTKQGAESYTRGHHSGYMFGGNFIYTSDSRFPSKTPIAVHDRVE